MIKNKLTFIASTLSLILIYVSSSIPISYYSSYLSITGITKATLSYSVASFFIGTMVAVLVFGRLSDYRGRKKIAIFALIIAIFGSLLFYLINGEIIFLLARLIQGFACGLAICNISSYVVDSAPNKQLASIITSAGSMLGLATGTLSSGIFAEFNMKMMNHIYIIIILILTVSIILILFSKETVIAKKFTADAIKPKISIPENVKYLFIPASPIFISTWALCGFYQGFSSTIAFNIFNIESTILTAIFFASITLTQAIGSRFITSLGNAKSQKIGMLGFSISLILIIFSLKYQMLIPFILLTLLCGSFIGLSFTASVDSILSKVGQNDYGNAFSSIYFISYAGIGVINIIVGQFANYYSLIEIAMGYLVLTFVSTAIVLITLRRFKNEQ